MTASRIVAAIFGAIFALASIALLFAGAGLLVAGFVRGQDGVLWSDSRPLNTPRYALLVSEMQVPSYPANWVPRGIADIRIDVTPGGAKPLFVGVGPAADVGRYLDGVGRDVLAEFDGRGRSVQTRTVDGAAPASPPASSKFWTASSEGAGARSLTWTATPGSWSAVIMNADASAGVSANARIGIPVPFLIPIALGLLIAGVVLAILGTGLLVWAVSRGHVTASGRATIVTAGGPVTSVYPVTLEGRLDEPLSRGLWLVKWFLAIPHFIILAFLWIAFWVVTLIAFFAILFSGRYPRGLFEFNVGVMRWTWRVLFYAFSPAATDRYPPFSLRVDPDYPARLDVAYPAELSRGLVLVKWWLLAIPHYIIVGLFTSGLVWWVTNPAGEDVPALRIGGGIISILVLVSLVALLFTGRYIKGLFDLVMGLDRWVVRVFAYATLMRDEYPPFRLDLGGAEPAQRSGASPSPPIGGAAASWPSGA